MHVPLTKITCFQVQGLVHRLFNDTQLDQPLSKDTSCCFMGCGVRFPNTATGDGGFLSFQHEVVEFTLCIAKRAADGPRARDVAGVTSKFRTRIDEHDLILAANIVVDRVMEDGGVLTAPDDGGIGPALTSGV